MSLEDYIRQTFEDWGYKSFQPMKDKILVRTHQLPDKSSGGLIYLPPKAATFHGELPNLQPIKATILAVGNKVLEVKVGDIICFMRLNFTWLHKCEDGTYVGLIQEPNVIGETDEDVRVSILH